MSVAFRRESDEEHKEPKFELPHPPGPNIVTPRGLQLIEQRVAGLEAELEKASTEERRTELQRDLRYWHSRHATAQVAPQPSGDSVAIGTRITIEQGGKQRTLTIVGHDEADPAAGLIAFTAPFVRPLIGAEAGELIEPSDDRDPILIVSIEPTAD